MRSRARMPAAVNFLLVRGPGAHRDRERQPDHRRGARPFAARHPAAAAEHPVPLGDDAEPALKRTGPEGPVFPYCVSLLPSCVGGSLLGGVSLLATLGGALVEAVGAGSLVEGAEAIGGGVLTDAVVVADSIGAGI